MNKPAKRFMSLVIGLGCCLASSVAMAQQTENNVEQQISELVGQLGLKVNSVSEAPVPGLLQVFTSRGLFFVSADGRYFMEATVYDLQQQELVNDVAMRGYIRGKLADYNASVIEYKAKNEKYAVTVFTDPTCGYCRKLHNEMQSYNDAGITVRYLAFPRGGINSETYLQLQHIWCAKDKRGAMNDAKSGKEVKQAMCTNTVRDQYELGQSFGISGTPAVILPNGRLIPGYQPAASLLEALQAE